MKIAPALCFLAALLMLAGLAEARLIDNLNYALGPGNSTYINVMVPADWGDVLKKTVFQVDTDCVGWCDVQGDTRIVTDMENSVVLPILVTAGGRKGDSKKFTVSVKADGKTRVFHYGVCVADFPGINVGEGNPCDVIGSTQNIIAMSLNPAEVHVKPGTEVAFKLLLQSEASLSLDLSTSMGGSNSVTLEPGELQQIDMAVNAPEELGEHSFIVTATAENCSLPSCESRASARIFVEENPQESARDDFSITVFPENYDTEKPETIFYTINIQNYGEPKEISAELFLPDGLQTSFEPFTGVVNTTQTIRVPVTVENGGKAFYTIKAMADSEKYSREAQATLSVNEMAADVQLSQDSATANQWNIDNTDQGMDNNIEALSRISEQEGNQNETPPPYMEEEPDMGWLIYLIVPIAIVAVVIFAWFYSKRRMVPGGEPVEQPFREE